MRLTAYEKKHPAYVKRLERCIKAVKKKSRKVNPWAICRAVVKK